MTKGNLIRIAEKDIDDALHTSTSQIERRNRIKKIIENVYDITHDQNPNEAYMRGYQDACRTIRDFAEEEMSA